ncbi:MAG: ADP-forming succinate--CoA ligase subunit beta [Chitinophagales bacterium]|nr:ADP-forming succinate--CoA ligase subunit beta [Chitinophagales bacterium]
MNLHEYQAKELMKKFGAKIQEGIMVESADAAVEAAKKLTADTGTSWHVIKAQVHAGGRGKAGGVKLAKNLDEVKSKAGEILGMKIINRQTGPQGKVVHKILVAQDVYYPGDSEPKEFYVSLLLDRNTGKNVFIYSTEGGMDIEEVAESTPHLVNKEFIDPLLGLQGYQLRKMAFNLGLEGQAFKEMTKFLKAVYDTYIKSDASMVEINPCLKTSDNQVIAVDGKISLDGNSLFRHPDLAEMRDVLEEDATEVEAGEAGLNYVQLDGNVGCMVNGAGLAMATMDMIKLSGGEPANFLDVGGTADAKRVETAFRIILKDKNVKAILVNIFGGIVRCDRVAQGIVDAYKSIGDIPVPLIVRLQGTNAKEGKELIDASGLKVTPVILLKEAADEVAKVLA